MPNPGTFTLHNLAVPDLRAGSYVVHAEQTITAPGADVEKLDAYVEVTAPRFSLPPDQVLSTFPPNKAEGEFSSRLPHIVLKRRTLPWERALPAGAGAGNPWLALVVLADAECEFKASQPIAQCVTAGVVLTGLNDTAVGDAIVVTDKVVRQVFPNQSELYLLAHVRNVDLTDTELAMGDDDGWLAVVLSNRLPRPGVRYGAYLISLEGQYLLLPDRKNIEDTDDLGFVTPFVYGAAALAVDTLSYKYGALVDGSAGTTPVVTGVGEQERGPAISAGRSRTVADAWSVDAAGASGTKKSAQKSSQPVSSSTRLIGDMHTVNMSVIDPPAPQYTFPVLAHWQFTCTGSSDFQALMQNLDVGMLGTLPRPPAPTLRGHKPPPPPTRAEPQVVETGHIAVQHVSRAGEPDTVWYRGPLVPHPTTRERPDASGRLPLLHASDQARRIGPDGRENLSLATAFEIGRLLALAEPSVVAALLNWRRQGFEQARHAALLNREPVLGALGLDIWMAEFAERAGIQVIAGLGALDAAQLGPVVPPVDPGRTISGIDGLDLLQLLSTGLGVPIDTVRDILEPGAMRTGPVVVPVAVQVPDLNQIAANSDQELAPVRNAALDTASKLAADALRLNGGAGAGGDALDRLLQDGRP